MLISFLGFRYSHVGGLVHRQIPRSNCPRRSPTNFGRMKVIIADALCTGHGRCYSLSPDVFDSDDVGHSVALVESVEGDLLRSAQAAASNCPERAISLVDE